jgi:hypothetical protein
MSRSTLEQVLELLINEEREAAEELLHDFIVENARQIHEELLSESDEVVEEDLEDLDESEEDYADDLEDDSDEIDTEEFYDEDEMGDDAAVDDLEMGDDMGGEFEDEGEGDVESRVDDLESALAQLEAEFEKIMSGEEGEEEGEGEEEYGFEGEDEGEDDDYGMEDEDEEGEEEDDFKESFDLDLDESEDDDLVEYVTPQTAKVGDNGIQNKTTVNANPKRPGDDSNAAPVRVKDGNTSGGKGEAPKDMSTKNVNVSGNKKSPAWKGQTAKPGDNGVNKKSLL